MLQAQFRIDQSMIGLLDQSVVRAEGVEPSWAF